MVVVPVLFLGGCISEEREKELGDRLSSDVNAHLPLIQDPVLLDYVHSLGTRIAEASERPDLDYHFYLVDTDVVNAFAIPGGHVYLTRGLIARVEDGPEFAGVIAHEIAHIAARHGVRKLQREMRTGSLMKYMYDLFLGGEPEVLRDNSLELVNAAISARHSRRDEHEADQLAVKYLRASGIDPQGVLTLLETLHRDERSSADDADRMGEWLSSHPLTIRRIEDARRDLDRQAPMAFPASDMSIEAFPAFKTLLTGTGANVSIIVAE
jgi:predicted Zn-dependent protease